MFFFLHSWPGRFGELLSLRCLGYLFVILIIFNDLKHLSVREKQQKEIKAVKASQILFQSNIHLSVELVHSRDGCFWNAPVFGKKAFFLSVGVGQDV